MKCMFDHEWGWPRKRDGKDVQVCLNCGAERESKVRFDPPRYRKTQDGIPNFSPSGRTSGTPVLVRHPGDISSAAA